PEVVERPRHVLDLALRMGVARGLTARFDAKNLLDAAYETSQGPVVRESYRSGRSFTLGLSVQRCRGPRGIVTEARQSGRAARTHETKIEGRPGHPCRPNHFTHRCKAMMCTSRKLLFTGLIAGLGFLAACEDSDGPGIPNAPTNVTVSAISPTSVQVSWTPADDDADGYEIARGEGLNANAFVVLDTVQASPFTDASLVAESAYSYRVVALRNGSRSPEVQAGGRTGQRGFVSIGANITADRSLSRDTVYRLTAFVQVTNGATLRIQDGTRIEGDASSALFITRGAKIEALGTAARPIVFTSSRTSQRRAGDWGGLIIIGNGVVNRTGAIRIEGTGTGENNPAQTYGGTANPNNADNSGTLRYVRIEFAGFGPATNAELNSLTLAAVGSGTTIDYVQTVYGLDDSFEWFGGAVDGKHLVSYESGDDHFDASEGYVGRNQHLIAFQSVVPTVSPGAGQAAGDPQGFEVDGCQDSSGSCGPAGNNAEPLTIPIFANFTVVGAPTGI
ncbi:MAG: fibronectin type III domain-containing protein, partial [Gemmatimonadetes bacterium]|nr:fibronectin type III domain-containing protein [Gemmatimonadota bacterium]